MVGGGEFNVDWLEEEAGEGQEQGIENGTGRRGGGEEEEEGWRRNWEAQEEGGCSRKRRNAMEDETQHAGQGTVEDDMLELRLSLAVAMSVPSPHEQQSARPPCSFVLHPRSQQTNHLHHQQAQLADGRNQSHVKELQLRRPSSLANVIRVSSQANLTASLKHLVSIPEPVTMKTVQRMPAGVGTARLPLQGDRSRPQHRRPQSALVRVSISSPYSLQDDQTAGMLASITQASPQLSTASLAPVGQKPHAGQFTLPEQSSLLKSLPQKSQSRPSSHLSHSRSALPAHPQQSSSELTQHGHWPPLLQGTLSCTADPRIATTVPFPSSIMVPSPPSTGAKMQAFSQHHSSTSLLVASQRQAYLPSQSGVTALGKNSSAFSVVYSTDFGTIPPSLGDIPTRDRFGDRGVVVSVCKRTVKLSGLDTSPLYVLCRRWVRNDAPRKDQSLSWGFPCLPRPMSVAEAGKEGLEAVNCREQGPAESTKTGLVLNVGSYSEDELLRHHVTRFRNVRKRYQVERKKRIARFMPRLALLLPLDGVNNRSGH